MSKRSLSNGTTVVGNPTLSKRYILHKSVPENFHMRFGEQNPSEVVEECSGVELDACEEEKEAESGGIMTNSNRIKKSRKKAEIETDTDAYQWSSVDGRIIPVSNVMNRLEPGYYTIGFSQSLGMFFEKTVVETNKLYRMPNTATDVVMNDIDKFWKSEETYKKYNRVFRRNYLLYSAPGTGKTSLINLMCKDLIEKYEGIVFYLDSESQIENFPDAIRRIRTIEKDRKIITIIEDIDSFTDAGTRLNTILLNILDGNLKLSGLVIIATTNHIELLEDRYTNRPSRFDRVIEFPLPNDASRKMFIESTVLPEDLKKIDINAWVDRTEGFTIDHINELILLFFVFGHSEEESFQTIEKMVGRKRRLRNQTSVTNKSQIGFAQAICDEGDPLPDSGD